MNRESYDFATIQTLYDTTALLSTAEVQKEYYKLFQGDNARDNILSNRAKIVATINSLILNQQNSTATVRFTTQLNHANGINHTAKHWVATLAYEYLNAPMHEEDRLINPLGFQITSYRVDPEINTDQNETLDVGL